MLNDTVLEEVIVDAGKRKAVVLLDLEVPTLDGKAILAEVVVDGLAISLYLLETGVLLDDAGVEPVGLGANRVDAGRLGLKGAIGCKGAASGLGLALRSDLKDARGNVAVFPEVVRDAVNRLPLVVVGGLAVHVVGLADLVGVPALVEGPLRIEREVRGEPGTAIGSVGDARAVGCGVPTLEHVAVAGKGVGRELLVNAGGEGLGFHSALATVGIKRHRVGVEGLSLELRAVIDVGGHLGALVDGGVPAAERVLEVLVVGLGGSLARVNGGFAIFDRVGLKNCPVVVEPPDGVLVRSLLELGGVGSVTRHLGRFGVPALEGIAKLSVALL